MRGAVLPRLHDETAVLNSEMLSELAAQHTSGSAGHNDVARVSLATGVLRMSTGMELRRLRSHLKLFKRRTCVAPHITHY